MTVAVVVQRYLPSTPAKNLGVKLKVAPRPRKPPNRVSESVSESRCLRKLSDRVYVGFQKVGPYAAYSIKLKFIHRN